MCLPLVPPGLTRTWGYGDRVTGGGALWRGALVCHTVVAALDTGMILIARDQQDGMVVAINVRALGGDLTAVVDLIHLVQRNSGVATHQQSIQVNRRSAILPQVRHIPVADDLPGGVN